MFFFSFQSRAALSLLGYCNFQLQNFVEAADCYEQLSILHPEVDDYRLYYAQSLYKACLYQEAMKVSCQIENPEYQVKVSLSSKEVIIFLTSFLLAVLQNKFGIQ